MGVISLSFSAGFMHSPMVLANSWFIRRRALAMTLISSSIGIGGTIITPMLAFSVQTWGWREGAFLAGLGLILTGVPLALLVQRLLKVWGFFRMERYRHTRLRHMIRMLAMPKRKKRTSRYHKP